MGSSNSRESSDSISNPDYRTTSTTALTTKTTTATATNTSNSNTRYILIGIFIIIIILALLFIIIGSTQIQPITNTVTATATNTSTSTGTSTTAFPSVLFYSPSNLSTTVNQDPQASLTSFLGNQTNFPLPANQNMITEVVGTNNHAQCAQMCIANQPSCHAYAFYPSTKGCQLYQYSANQSLALDTRQPHGNSNIQVGIYDSNHHINTDSDISLWFDTSDQRQFVEPTDPNIAQRYTEINQIKKLDCAELCLQDNNCRAISMTHAPKSNHNSKDNKDKKEEDKCDDRGRGKQIEDYKKYKNINDKNKDNIKNCNNNNNNQHHHNQQQQHHKSKEEQQKLFSWSWKKKSNQSDDDLYPGQNQRHWRDYMVKNGYYPPPSNNTAGITPSYNTENEIVLNFNTANSNGNINGITNSSSSDSFYSSSSGYPSQYNNHNTTTNACTSTIKTHTGTGISGNHDKSHNDNDEFAPDDIVTCRLWDSNLSQANQITSSQVFIAKKR